MKSCLAGSETNSFFSPDFTCNSSIYSTPFAVSLSEGAASNIPEVPSGDIEDVQKQQQRQKMYEKIITYKDNLSFERKKHRSSSLLLNSNASGSDGYFDNWQEPSEEAKALILSLVKYDKSLRLTAKQLLQADWFTSLGVICTN